MYTLIDIILNDSSRQYSFSTGQKYPKYFVLSSEVSETKWRYLHYDNIENE